MKTFLELALLEMARNTRKFIDSRDAILDDIHKKEIHSKEERIVGDIDGTIVIKSIHSMQSRDNEMVHRDYNLKDSVIIKAIKKAIKKGLRVGTGPAMITFKNKSKTYDLLVVDWRGPSIKIVTIIQGNRKSPKEYFTQKHSKDLQITTEDYGAIYIIDISCIL